MVDYTTKTNDNGCTNLTPQISTIIENNIPIKLNAYMRSFLFFKHHQFFNPPFFAALQQ
jgi:hypothetical protein